MTFIKTKLCTTLPIILLAAAIAPMGPVMAASVESADAIMAKVDHATRTAYSTQLASVKITTCKYMLVGGNVKCSEKPRVVVAENIKKGAVVDGKYNDKSLLIVREPISDKGTSLLVYEYGERNRDNDNWLYLPALGKVNRVIASDDDAGSVFGSEFSVETTENPEARKIYEYTYKILEETNYQNRPAWVIEMMPTEEKGRKTSYGKVISWIDKETHLPLKEDLYRNGKIHKQRTQTDIKNIDGVNVMLKVVINNRSSSRVSQMDYMAMRHNTEVPDDFLSQRGLTDFAFRERSLAEYRARLAK
ncbi:MAG TPA: outer membrane lipoprotein-sorting protein [Telluria sp.]|jgi:hypothetical protein